MGSLSIISSLRILTMLYSFILYIIILNILILFKLKMKKNFFVISLDPCLGY